MLKDRIKEFERKYSDIQAISDKWYEAELKIISMQKFNNPIFDSDNKYTEEWYRARLLYALVMEGIVSPELIGIELKFKKGSIKSTDIEPDILLFKNKSWKNQYNKYINDFRDSAIFSNILMVGEAKKQDKSMMHAIYNQMFPVMQMAQRKKNEIPIVFGFYFDNHVDLLLFKVEGLKMLERFSSLYGSDLGLEQRDSLENFPKHELLNQYLIGEQKIPEKKPSRLTYADLRFISEDSFNEAITTLKQKALTTGIKGVSDIQQRLITEIISLKMYDEECLKIQKYNTTKFYVDESESLIKFKNRFEKELINEAKLLGQNASLYKDNEYKFIREIVKVFQYYNFTESQNNTFNQAIFNNFGDNNIKTDLNQFFTPIPMMKSIIGIINPKPNETVYDPCSGICDFLSMAFLNAFNSTMKSQAQYYLYGSEINPETADLGKLNLNINGDARTPNIYSIDSANYKIMDLSTLSDADKRKVRLIESFVPYDEQTGQGFKFSSDNSTWEYYHPDIINPVPIFKADNIITNPPFGEGQAYKKEEIPMNLYELALINSDGLEGPSNKEVNKVSKSKIDKGIIFLENAYRCLKPGGKLAIVLSNSLMSKSEAIYVREWLLKKVRIVAILDFPQKSFADVDIATTVIIAYKPNGEEEIKKYLLDDSEYEYFSKNIEQYMIGYTKSDSKKKKAKRFNPIYMIDNNFEHINLNFVSPEEIISEKEIEFIYTNLKYSKPEIKDKILKYKNTNKKEFYEKNFDVRYDDLGGVYVINEKITSMVKEFKSWVLGLKIKEPCIYEKFICFNKGIWFGRLYEDYMD